MCLIFNYSISQSRVYRPLGIHRYILNSLHDLRSEKFWLMDLVIKSSGHRANLIWFKLQHPHLPAVDPWGSYLPSLNLSFLTYKMTDTMQCKMLTSS